MTTAHGRQTLFLIKPTEKACRRIRLTSINLGATSSVKITIHSKILWWMWSQFELPMALVDGQPISQPPKLLVIRESHHVTIMATTGYMFNVEHGGVKLSRWRRVPFGRRQMSFTRLERSAMLSIHRSTARLFSVRFGTIRFNLPFRYLHHEDIGFWISNKTRQKIELQIDNQKMEFT